MKTRLHDIDYLRGLAMMAMILIHTTVFYVSKPVAFFLWNYSQWAVPVFIFCSGYLYFKKTQNVVVPFMAQKGAINRATTNIILILKKRFLRLIIPYYIFLPFYLLFTELLTPNVVTKDYILRSLLIFGGIPINWMVLLFLQFAILLPIISWIYRRYRIVFWIYSFLAVGSSILFLFWKFPFDWRVIMWLPWSIVLIFSLFATKDRFKKTKIIFICFILSFIIYLLSLYSVHFTGHSMSFYDNKYPPNMFIISFGIGVISGFYFVKLAFNKFAVIPTKKQIPRLTSFARNDNRGKSLLVFLSRYSYSIYFIHYLILSLFTPWVEKLRSVWFLLFFLVFIPTVLIQKLLLSCRTRPSINSGH